MKGKLAICVPTYDHPDVVEQIILYCVKYLKENDVDIYYYDSSDNDETKRIINGVRDKGFDNVYRIEVTPDHDFGNKVDLILSGAGLEREYEYIWPIKDRTICSEYLLKLVLDRIGGNLKPDVIIALMLGNVFEGYHIDIDSPVELYKLFAKQTTSLETVIYSTGTILKEYEYGESVNVAKYRNDFWHYDFLYQKLAKLGNPVISIISKEGATNVLTAAAKDSGWKDRIFEVWIDEWVKVNLDLPDMYTPYKLQVIKDTASMDEILGSVEVYERLKDQGILTPEVFEKYKDMWEYVTTFSADEIRAIVTG